MEKVHDQVDAAKLVFRGGAIKYVRREGIRAPYGLSKDHSLDILPPISECYLAIQSGDLVHARKILNDLAAILIGSRSNLLDEVMLELRFRESKQHMMRDANQLRKIGTCKTI